MKTPLYITGTNESVGKTVITLGLVSEIARRVSKIGFIKPIGLARVRAGSDAIDLDALLMDGISALHENIKDMCPVTLGPTTWPRTMPGEAARVLDKIQSAYDRISTDREVVVVEGSGHAALGGGLGLSNATIAARFGCKTLICAGYGTLGTNPFDQALLNKAFFESHGSEVIGLIINRVPSDAVAEYRGYAQMRLEAVGIRMLGMIPEDPRLKTFRFLQVAEFLDGEMLCGQEHAEAKIHTVRVGAMIPHRALEFICPGALVITPGDREDIIVTACALAARNQGPSGLVLSGKVRPHRSIAELLKESGIPVFLADEDSYRVASIIHDMPLRIQPTDVEKVAAAKELVLEHVDIDAILAAL